jgi:hypothetical protein
VDGRAASGAAIVPELMSISLLSTTLPIGEAGVESGLDPDRFHRFHRFYSVLSGANE